VRGINKSKANVNIRDLLNKSENKKHKKNTGTRNIKSSLIIGKNNSI
jgi:hypothetical protein